MTSHMQSSSASVATVLNNKSASDYAKTKIQEIRKKFGYVPSSTQQPNKQNNTSSAHTPAFTLGPTPTNESQSNKNKQHLKVQAQPLAPINTNIVSTNSLKINDFNKISQRNGPKGELKSARNPSTIENLKASIAAHTTLPKNQNNKANIQIQHIQYQYEDRIKNIDSINRKIMQILKEDKNNSLYPVNNLSERARDKQNTNVQKSSARRYSINSLNPSNNICNNSGQRQQTPKPRQQQPQSTSNPIKQFEQTPISLPLSNNPAPNTQAGTTTVKKPVQELDKNLLCQPNIITNKNQIKKLNAISSNSNYSFSLNYQVFNGKEDKNRSLTNQYKTNCISIELSPSKLDDQEFYTKQYQIPKYNTMKEPYSFRSPRNDDILPQTNSQNKRLQKQKEKDRQRDQITKDQTIKLAKTIGEQITLDQKLRFSKWIFSQWDNPNKWSILQQKFNHYKSQNKRSSVKLYSYNMNIQQLKRLFTLNPDEHNPFFENDNRITQSCMQQLLKNYSEATDYWLSTVNQCVTICNLQKQYFNVKDIDLGKKGYLSIQDIVCFVNLYTGKFFRNRDAITVYKRFLGLKDTQTQVDQQERLKYQQFLDQVTK